MSAFKIQKSEKVIVMPRVTKRRPEAVLYQLSKAKQAALFKHGESDILVQTVAWLSQQGIKTSRTAVSCWLGHMRG